MESIRNRELCTNGVSSKRANTSHPLCVQGFCKEFIRLGFTLVTVFIRRVSAELAQLFCLSRVNGYEFSSSGAGSKS